MLDFNNFSYSLIQRINRFKPRKFHAYCIGAAKTGTTSVASMFKDSYRARHEQEVEKTNRLVIDLLEGKIDNDKLSQFLKERDRRLNLEMESSHPLGYLSNYLATLFPNSLFIITVREPLSWLKSRLNFHYKVHPKAWNEYRDYFWTQRNGSYNPEEKLLENYGLCSLDVYLSQYADHYRRVLEGVPEERRLIVRTSEIIEKIPDMAKFLGANPKKIVGAHMKRSENKITPLDEIDENYVKGRIFYHCESLINQFFPEKLLLYKNNNTVN
ncbi:hypothetical protein BH23BAC1_BH23BAC1_48150 [soil metagenome]